MRNIAIVALLAMFSMAVRASDFHEIEPIQLTDQFVIDSGAMGDARTIVVSLPDGYESGNHSYPVIYMLDGMQNIFHAAGTRDVLTRTGDMPPVILVGLKSVNRNLDMTPSRMEGNAQSGNGSKLLAHIRDEVIPFVEQTYRTNDYRVLAGHSLGGLFAAYALFEEPDLFDAEIIMSPALWWNDEEMIKRGPAFFSEHPTLEKSLFFGIGEDDGYGMRQELKRFVAEVKEANPKGVRLQHREFDGEGHMSAPLRAFYHGVKFIFSDMHLPDALMQKFTVDGFLEHEHFIQQKYGTAARQSQEIYVPIGYALIEKGDFDGAVAVFKRNEEAYAGNRYPRNNAWLANAYEKAGQLENALKEYQAAYQLSLETGYGEIDSYRQKITELGGTAE